MIPTVLQGELKNRVETIFDEKTFAAPYPEPGAEPVKLSVFEQNLPQKSQDDLSYFPFVIIKLMNGEQKGPNVAGDIHVGYVIGTFDAPSDNQGYRDVTEIINKISANLTEYPLVNGQFELEYPFKWRIHEEETDPYFFGVIETTWKAPTYTRSDVEEFI